MSTIEYFFPYKFLNITNQFDDSHIKIQHQLHRLINETSVPIDSTKLHLNNKLINFTCDVIVSFFKCGKKGPYGNVAARFNNTIDEELAKQPIFWIKLFVVGDWSWS